MLPLLFLYKAHVAGFTVENCKIVLAISEIKYANNPSDYDIFEYTTLTQEKRVFSVTVYKKLKEYPIGGYVTLFRENYTLMGVNINYFIIFAPKEV